MVAAATKPERRCALTRERGETHGLIRFVRSPDGAATPDLAEKLPGRGLWLTASADIVRQARRKNVFARGFKMPTRVPENLEDLLIEGLEARLDGLFGLARRAGDFVNGFDAVRDEVRSGSAALLVEAADGAADGRGKVLALARAAGFDGPVFGRFDAARIGLAVGRDNVVHGALLHGGLAEKALREVRRLAGFAPLTPETWSSDAASRADVTG